jgi:CRISPR-associated endonuclease Csn1
LERETFLPKQLTFANGVIPNQLHEREVRKILENASVTLPFLSEVGADGISNQEKIIRLFTFRLPYFIGPVSRNIGREDYKGNGWAVRREGSENDVVYPWNIENVIDYDATRAEFITRMVRECSYLAGEKVLPKESMEYQAFMVLNTINNIRINGEKISCALKQDIYHDVFEKKGGRITKKKILEYLNHRGIAVEEKELGGIDTTIGCQLSTYQRFHGVFGENMAKDSVRHMVEDIVFKGTVYGESKAMLKEMLKSTYEDMLTEQQLKQVLGFKYRDWGNLSKAFLELEGCNCETGEAISLIRALWEDADNLNMMELLHSEKYTFSEVLKEKHQSCMKPMTEFTYQDLDEMYFSAPVKRMIWQTLLLIREITEVLGCYPKKIFVEMTRTEEEKKGDAGRKDSREKELLNLYKFIKDDRSWDEEIREAGSSGRLRSKKLYLYYKQMGRDMYTGLPIDLQGLFDDNKYDIDHIYPRHYVKDDSIHNNLVLVDKRKNSRKSDNYPLDEDIRKKETPLWSMLHKKGFLNDEKYRRLTGSRSFTEEQKADFIARQLVETGQATKGVNDLLKEILPEGTRLVYSKAGNVSDFRRDFGFYKSRIINDFHHAHDAYLNIVVGNVYDTKFTTNPLNFIKNERTGYHMGKMFDRDVVRNGYMAWQAPIRDDVTGEVVDAKESLTMVRTMLAKNTPLMTRLTRPQQGKLSEATIYCATDAKEGSYLPLKSKNDRKREDVTKYGGLKSIQNAYCFLVEHEVVEGKGKNKGKTIKVRTLEYLPIYKRAEVEGSADGLLNYCLELGLKNPSIRLKKINPKSLMVVNGFPVCLAGKNQSQFSMENACNLILQPQWTEYIHFIDKSNRICRLSQEITAEKNLMLYDELVKKHTEGIFAKRPNPIGEKLKKDREKFMELSAERQILVLTEILKLSSIGSISSSGANLKDIGESPSTGTIKLNRNISKLEQCKLVHTSVTGLFEKEVDLLTV